jgi:predicted transcriptional regulator
VDRLGELEAEIMDVMWSAPAPMTVRNVLDSRVDARPLAYTTVMTVMDRLFRKGWLTRKREGRSYLYQPAVSRSVFAARRMTDILATTEDKGLALLRFIENLDPAEYEALREAVRWRSGRGAGED